MQPVAESLLRPPPLSLYLHWPWCERKCPYCDFNSHSLPEAVPERAYLQALIADLEQTLPAVWRRPLRSLFIGGGTPSLISAEGIDWLLTQIRARLPLLPDAEITLEANPGSADQQRFADYRQAGVNRLSIGVQSFDDQQLQRLGRIHNGATAREAIEAARLAGFNHINLDLMFALPGQQPADLLADLDQALAYAPEHLSWYQLTLEPNTPFAQQPPAELPDDDRIWALQQLGSERLAAAGFRPYEVSAWARATDLQCRHNLNYWQFGDYLGIGAGAHAKLTDAATGRIWREQRARHPRRYLDAFATEPAQLDTVISRSEVSAVDARFEFMLNAMRLSDGVAATLLSERIGQPLTALQPALDAVIAAGLLQPLDGLAAAAGRLQPTPLGQRHLNQLLLAFLP